jgi:uncharacterized protein YqeY
MSLEAKIMESLKTAMKAKYEVALRTLRAIKAAIIIEKTAEGASGEIDEATEIKMLQKMAKQRKDSLQIFEQQQREDLASKEREELAIIEEQKLLKIEEERIKKEEELEKIKIEEENKRKIEEEKIKVDQEKNRIREEIKKSLFYKDSYLPFIHEELLTKIYKIDFTINKNDILKKLQKYKIIHIEFLDYNTKKYTIFISINGDGYYKEMNSLEFKWFDEVEEELLIFGCINKNLINNVFSNVQDILKPIFPILENRLNFKFGNIEKIYTLYLKEEEIKKQKELEKIQEKIRLEEEERIRKEKLEEEERIINIEKEKREIERELIKEKAIKNFILEQEKIERNKQIEEWENSLIIKYGIQLKISIEDTLIIFSKIYKEKYSNIKIFKYINIQLDEIKYYHIQNKFSNDNKITIEQSELYFKNTLKKILEDEKLIKSDAEVQYEKEMQKQEERERDRIERDRKQNEKDREREERDRKQEEREERDRERYNTEVNDIQTQMLELAMKQEQRSQESDRLREANLRCQRAGYKNEDDWHDKFRGTGRFAKKK